MKVCSTCKEEKSLESFGKRNDVPSGLSYVCKVCKSASTRRAKATPEGRAKAAKYSRDNRHIHRAYERTIPRWKKRAKDMARKAAKDNRTPSWLTDKHKEQIKDYYWLAKDLERINGEPYHVDHIVPLRGKDISGLHVPWNLQVLPAKINMSKGNRYGRR